MSRLAIAECKLSTLETYRRADVQSVETNREEARRDWRCLSDRFNVLCESLGLSYRETPIKREFVKKGGPERG